MYVHPRYAGDVENPTGGVRHVMPGKGGLYEMRLKNVCGPNTL